MKKVLYATTALVATTGFAAAQVADEVVVADPVVVAPAADDAGIDTGIVLTGFAEIGVIDPGDDASLQFATDIDVTFTMTAETDGGLQFGANIDLDESDPDTTIPGTPINQAGDTGAIVVDTDEDGMISAEELDLFLQGQNTADLEIGGSPAFDDDTQGGESIFVSGAFGTLTMGDTDGAFDWALEEAIIGSTLNDENEHAGYSGNAGLDGSYDGQIARYEYAFGDFGVAVSAEIDDSDEGDPALGIGFRYSTGIPLGGRELGIGLGLGYQRIDSFDPIGDLEDALDDDEDDDDDGDNPEIFGVSADVDFGGGLRGIINYSDGDNTAGAFEHIGAAVGYTVDALTVAVNYGRFDLGDTDNDEIENDADGYGVTVNYDLGAGAEAQFGYSYNDVEDVDFERFSAGIAVAF